jgi:hypothetical protein
MTMIWTVSLLCWSGAAVLVASLAFPDIFDLFRPHNTRDA